MVSPGLSLVPREIGVSPVGRRRKAGPALSTTSPATASVEAVESASEGAAEGGPAKETVLRVAAMAVKVPRQRRIKPEGIVWPCGLVVLAIVHLLCVGP